MNSKVQIMTFLDRNTSMLTLLGFKDALKGVTIFPDLLKSLSDEALVAGIPKYFFDTFEKSG